MFSSAARPRWNSGCDLEHHAVLVRLREYRRHQPLAEGAVQGAVDGRGRDAEPARRGAVELDIRLQPAILQVAGHVCELRHLLQPVDELVHPGAEFAGIHRLDGELVLRAADASLDRQVLHRLHVERDALDLGEFRLQAPDDVRCTGPALGTRLEVDQQPSAVQRGVGAVDADERRQAGDGGVFENDGCQRLLPLRHGREGDRLGCLRNALDGAGVLHREKALGNDDVEHDRQHQCQDGDDEGGTLAIQHPVQHDAVAGDHPLEQVAAPAVEATLVSGRRVAQQLRAHHRRQRQ